MGGMWAVVFEVSRETYLGRMFRAEGTTIAKPLKQDNALCVPRTAGMGVIRLESSNKYIGEVMEGQIMQNLFLRCFFLYLWFSAI